MDSLIILHFRVIRTYAGNKSMLIFDAQLSPRYASASTPILLAQIIFIIIVFIILAILVRMQYHKIICWKYDCQQG